MTMINLIKGGLVTGKGMGIFSYFDEEFPYDSVSAFIQGNYIRETIDAHFEI